MQDTLLDRPKEPAFSEYQGKAAGLMRPQQLRRLHALWRRWTGKLGLPPAADRELRHYYIWLFSGGRTHETVELTEPDAAQVILRLAELVRRAEAPANYAAGTAGRRGYPERKRVRPNSAAWRALWRCAAALGMGRPELESFIRRHYSGAGLQSLADIRTMADLNRVLWGLKAMLRHSPSSKRNPYFHRDAA